MLAARRNDAKLRDSDYVAYRGRMRRAIIAILH